MLLRVNVGGDISTRYEDRIALPEGELDVEAQGVAPQKAHAKQNRDYAKRATEKAKRADQKLREVG